MARAIGNVLAAGVALGLALGLSGPASAREAAPYAGVWDCGVGTFVFTDETYNPGDQMLVPERIERDADGTYTFSFADGYAFAVGNLTETTMFWLSGESGDGFECTRLHY